METAVKITPTKHPAEGMRKDDIEAFEYLAIGMVEKAGMGAKRRLLKAGLIVEAGEKVLGRDMFGLIKIPDFEVPLPLHYQWCKWCSENISDEEAENA